MTTASIMCHVVQSCVIKLYNARTVASYCDWFC